jgi:NADH-quinone oxidoreductase subunit M
VSSYRPLAVITIWLGIYPKPVLEPINNSVEAVVQLMHDKSITAEAKSRIPNVMNKNNEGSETLIQEAH